MGDEDGIESDTEDLMIQVPLVCARFMPHKAIATCSESLIFSPSNIMTVVSEADA